MTGEGMRALIYTNNEQEYELLRKITEEEIDGIIVRQVRMDGHFHVEEDSDIAVIALNGAIIWITDDQYFGRTAIRNHIFDFIVRPYPDNRYREAVRGAARNTA